MTKEARMPEIRTSPLSRRSAPHLDPLPAPSGERRAGTRLSRIPVRFGDPDTVPPKVPLSLCKYVFSVMVGTARCAVPARVVAGGTNDRAALAFEGVAPLHAARTSQRDVPTTFLVERERRMGNGGVS